jgi:hypothetical protein
MSKRSIALLIGFLFVFINTAFAQAAPDAAKTKAADAPKASSLASGLASLPVAAQSTISTAIGRDQSDFHARPDSNGRFRTLNSEGQLAADFSQSGVVVRAGAQGGTGWGLAFEGYGRGRWTDSASSAAATPQASANRVEYRRGDLTEWYVNGPLGIEQGFSLARPPSRTGKLADQPLTIALALSGDLTASLDSNGTGLTLKQHDGQAVLRYSGLSAQDAAGRQLRSWIELRGSQLLLQIDDAGAHYPVIVDPWVQAVVLSVSSPVTGEFGRSVAVAGNTIVVGAPTTTILGNANQGAVFVFVEPVTGGWAAASMYELTASDGRAGDFFGGSVGIDAGGDTIVVGASQILGSGGPGVAYVFVEPTPGGWATTSTYNAELLGDDVTLFGEFGSSVAIDAGGDTVVVGASFNPFIGYGSTNPDNQKGEAYVFVEPPGPSGPAWTPGPLIETAKLIASDGKAGDALGFSVGINESGNTVVAGATDATINAQYQGAAYVFVEPTGGWVTPTATPNYNAKLFASDATPDSYLGWSVGISGNTVVAGATDATINAQYQGAAYVFVDPGPNPADWATPTTTPTYNAVLTASDGAARDEFGTSVAISGNTVVVGAPAAKDGTSTPQGAAYVFAEPTTGGWTSTSTSSKLTGGTVGSSFSSSAGINGNTIVVGDLVTTNGAAYVFTQTFPYASFSNTTTGSPSQVTFGNVTENTSATQTVTVTNTGAAPLIIQLVLPETGTGFSVPQFVCSNGASSSSIPPYPITLNAGSPGDSCTFTVQFDPTSVGPLSGYLQFGDNAGVGESNLTSTINGSSFTQTVQLSGIGASSSSNIAIFSTGEAGFPISSAQVGSSVTSTPFTLTNEGSTAMTVSLITVTTSNSPYSAQFFLSSASCAASAFPRTTFPAYTVPSFTITAGDICTFTLGFAPEVAGAVTGQITFAETAASSNICGTGSLATCTPGSNGYLAESIPMSGTGTGNPAIAGLPQSVNFSNQTVGLTATAAVINLSNTGNVPVYFAAVGIQGTNAADFKETSTCSTSTPLPPSGINVCMITVTFTPSIAGPESATLFITNSAVNTNIPLTGTGVVPTATATPGTVPFGLQLDSNPLPAIPGTAQSVTLQNKSTNTAVLTGIIPTITVGANTNASDFSISSTGTTCGSTLAAGASCTINVVFAPSVAGGGVESATLSIADNASTPEPQTVVLSGTGVSFTAGKLSLSGSVTGGQTYTDTISFTLAPGSGTLVLSCAGLTGVLPAGTTCLFSDAAFPTPAATLSVPQTNAVQTVTVTIWIKTTAELVPMRRRDLPPTGLLRWLPLLLIAAILLFSFRASLAAGPQRGRKAAWALLLLVVLCGGWLAACGSPSGGGTSPTPTGTNTFVITAKLGSLTQTINVVLNVT